MRNHSRASSHIPRWEYCLSSHRGNVMLAETEARDSSWQIYLPGIISEDVNEGRDNSTYSNSKFSTAYIKLYWPNVSMFFIFRIHRMWTCSCVLCKWNNIYLSLLNLRECRMAGRLWRRFHKCSVSSAQAATKAPCSRKNIDMIINSAIHSVLPYILLWRKITLIKFNFFTMSDFWCSSFSQFWSIFADFIPKEERHLLGNLSDWFRFFIQWARQ